MDFIHGVEGIARLPIQTAENYSNEFANLGNRLAGRQDQTIQQNMGGNPVTNAALNFSQATGKNAQLGGDVAQVGVAALAPGIAGPAADLASPFIDAATQAGGKIVGGAVKGAVEGAAINAPSNVAQAVGNGQKATPSNLAMDFVQGAGFGAATGGVLGGGAAALQGAVKPVMAAGNPSDQLSDADLQKLATTDSQKVVQKTLEPITGPIVAKQLAPSIASDSDANTIKNQIDQSVNNKIAPAIPNLPSPAPADITPPTPVNDLNTATPGQQGSASPVDQLPITPTTPTSDVNTPAQVSAQAATAQPNLTAASTPLSNQDILNEFGKNRSSYGNDNKFYNEFVMQAADMPNKAGDLAAEIIGQVENNNIPIKDALDNSINPDVPRTPMDDYHDARTELVGIAQRNNQPQLLKQFDEQTKGMSLEDKTQTLNEALNNYRNKGGMLAEQGGNSPPTPEKPTSEQASLNATAPPVEQPNFMNAPTKEGEETAQAAHVSKLGAVIGMHDILNQGGTTDEALNHYMETTGSGYGEAQGQLNDLINQSGTEGSLDRSKINASLNPQTSKATFPEATTKDAAVLNGQYANNTLVQAGRPALEAMQQLDDHDLALVRELKGNQPGDIIAQANDKAQFAKVVSSLKDYNDYTQAAGAELGQPIPYRQNYGLRTPYAAPEDIANGQTPNASLPENAAYTKSRQYNTHQEALANGEAPRYDNALQDLQSDINNRAHDQSQLALAKGLENAYPGQVKIINQGQIPTGYQQLLIPNGDKIFMPSEIASKINERAMATPANGAMGKYDSINAAGKNLELGGGLFHSTNTGGIFVGQQMTSGKLFTNPAATGRVIANTFSDTATKNYLDTAAQEGTFDANHSVINAADATGLKYSNTSADIGKPGDTGAAGKIASLPILKQVHQAIFERQIPTMMLETFKQKTQGLDIFGNAADREQGIKIAKEINQNYGSINRDIQGLTPKQFQRAARVVLAASYQEGQIRTLVDAISKGGPEGALARQAVFGKALLFGGLATLGAAAGGDFKNQTPKQIALDIMNKVVNPSFNIGGYRVGLPATQISNVVKPIEQTITGAQKGKGVLTGAENFANSHLAFAPSKAIELGANKNYSGNAIYGKDYFGRPIPLSSTLANVASGVLPIPLAQAEQTGTGNQSVGAAIANTVGFNATPQGSLEYSPIAAQTYLQQLQATPGIPKSQINADTNFVEALGQGDTGRSKVLKQATSILAQARKSTDPNAATAAQTKVQTLISKYNQQLAKALVPWAQSPDAQYFDSNMLQLLRSTMITFKNANSNVNYDIKTNPTAYGVPVSALTTAPNTNKKQGA